MKEGEAGEAAGDRYQSVTRLRNGRARHRYEHGYGLSTGTGGTGHGLSTVTGGTGHETRHELGTGTARASTARADCV